ncbi:GspE/PulE family protein [Anaerolentibacter hominis]|uniref:GspE/PulE family protein n=1 Tax=Anaerolentibacter hominis TaxID=3079009 RepID=UPI0031B8071E
MGTVIRNKRIRLGDFLVQKGLLEEKQLEKALEEQRRRGTKLGETILDLGYITEQDLADALCELLDIEYVELRKMNLDEKVVHLINEDVAKRYKLIPIGYDENNNNIIKVAMADPMDVVAIDDVAIITNMQVEPVLSTTSQVAAQIDKFFGEQKAKQAAESFRLEQEAEGPTVLESVLAEVENSPVVQLVNTIIEQAVHRRASDIHIEPLEEEIRLRYRVDGVLSEIMSYDSSLLPAIVSRVKIMSGMDISEKRIPQDGRATAMVEGYEYDIRVSTLPTVHGEKVVMRLSSKQSLTLDKRRLGFYEDDLERFNQMLSHPHGIILVTGPTGSGKTTTMYTALSELNTEFVNIVTIEDPVEANVDGINQVQVNNKADLTFASILRSILRQDPDIIMIGEIRDKETANIAIQAAITGHLVLSTVHTNNTAATVGRLLNMGVESFLMADALTGIIAQRLARKLCDCKVPYEASRMEKMELGLPVDQPYTLYRAGGCPKCNHSGYYGRIGIFEMMTISPRIREMISVMESSESIRHEAQSEGMSTLYQNLRRQVLDGMTSVEEMRKVEVDNE